MTEGARRIAGPMTTLLAVVSALLLAAAVVTGYASDAFFDSDEFAERATAALAEEAVQAELAQRVTDDLVLGAEADLVAVRPVIESVVSGIVGGGAFQGLFEAAVRDVHRAVFEGDQNTVTLTVADFGSVARGALQALQPRVAKRIGPGEDVDLAALEPPAWTAGLARTADRVGALALILLVLGIACGVATVLLARDRRTAVLRLGIAAAICGVALAVGLGIARAVVLGGVEETASRDALAGVWDAFLGDLRTALFLFAGCGVVVAAAGSSLLRPVDLDEPLRRAWQLATRVPSSHPLRALRAIALVAIGALIVTRHRDFLDLVAIAAGLYIAYAGVSELMRMTLAGGPDERGLQARQGRRSLIAGAAAATVIVAAGALFAGLEGADPAPAEIATVGCNGSVALCDQPLDEVAFPATHNAMSAVNNPGFLFGMHEDGFPGQLRDGVRGLLIDAHYGQATADGTIKTDLSDLSGPERDAYEEALGSDALDAALRIRDRIVDSPSVGAREVYLCHRFCELGAVPIGEAFGQYRDFLAANPAEVLVIVIEDYVAPEDIAAAAEESGLEEYVYEGPVGPPWPTLQEMIDSGGRVLMLAENDAGGGAIPWYHEAHDELVQETPFRFTRPAELTDPERLPASCEPNRGPADASLFLINHWIDTSPAPRPSNAKKVNTAEALSRRIAVCEEERGLPAGLIAVDFYREGDLFGVVDELNRTRAEATAGG